MVLSLHALPAACAMLCLRSTAGVQADTMRASCWHRWEPPSRYLPCSTHTILHLSRRCTHCPEHVPCGLEPKSPPHHPPLAFGCAEPDQCPSTFQQGTRQERPQCTHWSAVELGKRSQLGQGREGKQGRASPYQVRPVSAIVVAVALTQALPGMALPVSIRLLTLGQALVSMVVPGLSSSLMLAHEWAVRVVRVSVTRCLRPTVWQIWACPWSPGATAGQ